MYSEMFRLGHGPQQVGAFNGSQAGVAKLAQISHDLAQQRQFFLQRIVGGKPPPYIVREG